MSTFWSASADNPGYIRGCKCHAELEAKMNCLLESSRVLPHCLNEITEHETSQVGKACVPLLHSELQTLQTLEAEDSNNVCQFQYAILDTCARIREDRDNIKSVRIWFLFYIHTTLLSIFPDLVVMRDPTIILPKHPTHDRAGLDDESTIFEKPLLLLLFHPSGSGETDANDDSESSCDDEPTDSEFSSDGSLPDRRTPEKAPLAQKEERRGSLPRRMTLSGFCDEGYIEVESALSEDELVSVGSGDSSSVLPLDEASICYENSEYGSDFVIDEDVLAKHMPAREGEELRAPLASLLCVGTSESIWGTIASSLYQRQALGIEGPIFGILVDEEACTARVLVGWLDHDQVTNSQLPFVRLDDQHKGSLFDITSPRDCFALTKCLQLLTDLCKPAMREEFVTFPTQILRWRMDNLELSPEVCNLGLGQDVTMELWRQKACSADSMATTPANQIEANQQLQQASFTAKSDRRYTENAVRTPAVDFAAANTPENKKRNSLWRLGRLVTIHRVPNPPMKVASALHLYFTCTRFHNLDFLFSPEVTPHSSIIAIHDQIRAKWKRYCNSHPANSSNWAPMEHHIQQHIMDNISAYLNACHLGAILKLRKTKKDIDAGEACAIWNAAIALTSKISPGSTECRFDQLINLAQNDHYASLLSPGVKQEFSFARRMVNNAVYGEFEGLLHLPQESAAWAEPQDFETLRAFLDDASEVHPATQEPYTGICDLVITTTYPLLIKSSASFFSRPMSNNLYPKAHLRPTLGPRSCDVTNPSDIFASARFLSIYDRDEEQSPSISTHEGSEISSDSDSFVEFEGFRQPLSQANGIQPLRDPAMEREPTEMATEELNIPLLLFNHKARLSYMDPAASVNLSRMNATSAARLLEALGIYDFLVFSLLTEGTVGVVTSTSASRFKSGSKVSSQELVETKVYERNAFAFDIGDPIGFFHFVGFVAQVSTTAAADLKRRLEEQEQRNPVGLQWNMNSQFACSHI